MGNKEEYRQAYSALECMAIDLTGAMASAPHGSVAYYENRLKAINIAQELIKEKLGIEKDRCTGDWAYSPCDSRSHR